MSIYSGFQSREREEEYYMYLEGLLYALQKRIVKFYRKQQTNEVRFTAIIQRFNYNMTQLEKVKFLKPKFTQTLKQLLDCLGISKKKIKDNQTHVSEHSATVYEFHKTKREHKIEKIHEQTPKLSKLDMKTANLLSQYKSSPSPVKYNQFNTMLSDREVKKEPIQKKEYERQVRHQEVHIKDLNGKTRKNYRVYKTARNSSVHQIQKLSQY